MSHYLLIESRDPFESQDSATFLFATATELVSAGHRVSVFLVQNGALAARGDASLPALAAATRAGVAVFADSFSLRERGIDEKQLAPEVLPVNIGYVIERLTSGDRVMWH